MAAEATKALRTAVPRCTGMLVDTLLDPMQEFVVRRRLPAILEVGEPALATWGLRRGLADTRFEVRYRCARALAHLRGAGHELGVDEPEVFAAIERELAVDSDIWQSHKLLDPSPNDSDELVLDNAGTSSRALEHVFTLLGLTLPSSPVRIALQALHTHDRALRATALEYLESVLPAPLRAMLWPHLESANAEDKDDALAALIPTLTEDPAAWAKLKGVMESALFEMIARPGFLDRDAPSLETRKALVDAIILRMSEDNYRRLHRYVEFQQQDPHSQFTSWLRTEAKRVGRAHLRGVALAAEVEETHGLIEARPRDEIAADLMLSRPSVVAMLGGQNKK